ncbi:TetR/AcrR family transcriptional regulator [Piscinibacter koreensis]|uniref:TetR/AcrR family transcriptional regulator n=1 Tax=Piscinibacter koreensis TaxID=2742824 RepID=A0A7Y6TXM2_9BURK|nr:TetR/AcrR family transcriptional regulator [Schlegelella koreensis]NUZ07308.1 TetR/AcrR family transcriptional regulator [Schlegelella koreensis]
MPNAAVTRRKPARARADAAAPPDAPVEIGARPRRVAIEGAANDGATPRRKTLRQGEALTRKHVLGTVYELISRDGIENLSMRKVAVAAGLSTGTINYHFGNKQRLLIAALESAYELPDDWERYQGSPVAQLERLLTGYVCRLPTDRFWRFWINYLASSVRDAELLTHQTDRLQRQQRFWTRLIHDGIAAGELASGVDAARKAEELLILAHGLVLRQLADPGEASRDLARELLLGQVRQMRAPARRASTA